MEKSKGHYLGTAIDGKWWKRYMGKDFFARGNGEYWYDEQAFYFQCYLTRRPLVIPFQHVRAVQLGRSHCGRWACGAPVVKLIWQDEELSLSSGFVLSRREGQVRQLADEFRHRAALDAP
jgi:hypothetical protein